MLNLLIPYFGYSPWIIHRLDMRTSGGLHSARCQQPLMPGGSQERSLRLNSTKADAGAGSSEMPLCSMLT